MEDRVSDLIDAVNSVWESGASKPRGLSIGKAHKSLVKKETVLRRHMESQASELATLRAKVEELTKQQLDLRDVISRDSESVEDSVNKARATRYERDDLRAQLNRLIGDDDD